MRTKKSLPKIHLACANDSLRPVMEHILITKDEIVASDAHIIVIHKTENIFDEESIKAMPERFLIHKNQWKEICKNHDRLTFKNNQIIVNHNNTYNFCFDISFENDYAPKGYKGYYAGNFPDYKKVIPTKFKESVYEIGLNPKLLKNLVDTMFFPYAEVKNIKFTFYGKDRAIIVEPADSSVPTVKGLIMPVMITI